LRCIQIDDLHLNWNSLAESLAIIKLSPDLIIVDRLSTKSGWIKRIVSKNTRIIVFDDNGSGSKFANATINGILHGQKKRRGLFQGYKFLYLGFPQNLIQSPIEKSVSKIVVTFGGHDERNLVCFFLESIQNINFNRMISITILVRETSDEKFVKWKLILDQLNSNLIEISIINNATNFYEIVATADLLITSGGITVFEAVALGRPVIGIPQYLHQLRTLRKLKKLKVVEMGSCSMSLNKEYFMKIFNDITSCFIKRQKLSYNCTKLIKRNSSDLVLQIISKEINVCKKKLFYNFKT